MGTLILIVKELCVKGRDDPVSLYIQVTFKLMINNNIYDLIISKIFVWNYCTISQTVYQCVNKTFFYFKITLCEKPR